MSVNQVLSMMSRLADKYDHLRDGHWYCDPTDAGGTARCRSNGKVYRVSDCSGHPTVTVVASVG